MHEAWPPFTSCHRADHWIPSGPWGTSPWSIREAVRWAHWHGNSQAGSHLLQSCLFPCSIAPPPTPYPPPLPPPPTPPPPSEAWLLSRGSKVGLLLWSSLRKAIFLSPGTARFQQEWMWVRSTSWVLNAPVHITETVVWAFIFLHVSLLICSLSSAWNSYKNIKHFTMGTFKSSK